MNTFDFITKSIDTYEKFIAVRRHDFDDVSSYSKRTRFEFHIISYVLSVNKR